MKTITINVPDDCEVQIVKRQTENQTETNQIRTYQDLVDNKVECRGYYITVCGDIDEIAGVPLDSNDRNVAATEKVAKSMLAMAMISQLMPYYGGAITDEEWHSNKVKYVIERHNDNIHKDSYFHNYNFLAFHTGEQANEFLRHNEQLVKDYLMID